MKTDEMLGVFHSSQKSGPDFLKPASRTSPGGRRPRSRYDAARPKLGHDGTSEGACDTMGAFILAAQRFDPRSMTRAEMAELALLLRQRAAISDRDHLILQTDPTAGRMAVARDLAAPRDAIKDWQQRRAIDMERGRIQAVEASTRALALLGRVAALRSDESDA